MRIALFHNLPSGGGKRTLYEMARRLAAGHKIDVYTLSCANHDFADLRPLADAYTIAPFQPAPLLSSPLGRLNQGLRLVDLFRLRPRLRTIAGQIAGGAYDLLFVHPCQIEIASTLLSYLRGRLPAVYYCQEPLRRFYEEQPARPYDDDHLPRRRFLNRLDPLLHLYRLFLKRIDRRNTQSAGLVLVNSMFMQQTVRRIYRVEAEVSYHGVDTDYFRPQPAEKRGFVLSVGSLTPLKGFDFLIEAVARLPADRRPPLVIASNFQNPPEQAYLEQLAEQRGVALELLGQVDDEQLLTLYNQAAVVAYAAIREPFGLVPLEAMACGVPVVAVRDGGVQESVIHEQTGLLTGREPEQFAFALQQLLDDPQLAACYGGRGREQVLQNWTWDRAARALEERLVKLAAIPSH